MKEALKSSIPACISGSPTNGKGKTFRSVSSHSKDNSIWIQKIHLHPFTFIFIAVHGLSVPSPRSFKTNNANLHSFPFNQGTAPSFPYNRGTALSIPSNQAKSLSFPSNHGAQHFTFLPIRTPSFPFLSTRTHLFPSSQPVHALSFPFN